MKARWTAVALIVVWLAEVGIAGAMTLRYAIIVGNNSGVDANGHQPFDTLRHAEGEARQLHDRFIALANFDSSPSRTILLLGATRAQVIEASRTIAARMAADRKQFGQVDTLFVFYFTGHGLNGRLLLSDAPLTAAELGGIFRTVNATFGVGVFDACYSGSLDHVALAQKGVELTPGLNLFQALPDEVLTAEGSVWFVSSGQGEVSYEDKYIGGVFTHFFIEAMEKAPVDGPGITLENVWHYVRKNTLAYTTRHRRRQVPQQFVARMRSTGPIYFSFPVERSARLVLAESLEGRFVLSYADGQLVETIDKQRGQRQQVAVYPGTARLCTFKDEEIYIQESIHFDERATVVLQGGRDLALRSELGEGTTDLWEKGIGARRLTAKRLEPIPTVSIGAVIQGRFAPSVVLQPKLLTQLAVRLDRGRLVLGALLGYGRGGDAFESWSYDVDALHTELHAGMGWNLGSVRLAAGGAFTLARLWQRFDDDSTRTAWTLQPGVLMSLVVPSHGRLMAEFTLSGGASLAPGVGRQAESVWRVYGGAGIALMVRL